MRRKLLNGFKELSYFNKSTLIATWIQTIAIVFGIIVAINQLSAAVSTTDKERRKESLSLIDEFKTEQRENYAYLQQIYKKLLSISANSITTEERSRIIKNIIASIDENKLNEVYSELNDFYDKAYTCTQKNICDKETIGVFLCEKSDMFLSQGKKSDEEYNLDIVFKELRSQLGDEKFETTILIKSIRTMHFWNIDRMCSWREHVNYFFEKR